MDERTARIEAMAAAARGDWAKSASLWKIVTGFKTTAQTMSRLCESQRRAGEISEAEKSLAVLQQKWPDAPEVAVVAERMRMTKPFNDTIGSHTMSLQPPPEMIPPEMEAAFTMNSAIPVHQMYFNQRSSRRPIFRMASYEEAFLALKAGTFNYYEDTGVWLQEALRSFQITDATVAVFGGVRVNSDAIALMAGARQVYVIEYNVPTSEHPQVMGLSLEDALADGLQTDVAFSISSFEHDGLGRYGDPLDPDGDLRAMQEARRILKPGGLLFLAVPVGRDCIYWNAHRIYGRKRLPKLLEGWTVEASYGFDERVHYDVVIGHRQPVFVLRA